MAEKTFTRWTSLNAEEIIKGDDTQQALCDEEQKKWCEKDGDNCDTCHEVKIMIKVEDV